MGTERPAVRKAFITAEGADISSRLAPVTTMSTSRPPHPLGRDTWNRPAARAKLAGSSKRHTAALARRDRVSTPNGPHGAFGLRLDASFRGTARSTIQSRNTWGRRGSRPSLGTICGQCAKRMAQTTDSIQGFFCPVIKSKRCKSLCGRSRRRQATAA